MTEDRGAVSAEVRASDDERSDVVAVLRGAGGEGRLTVEEMDQRIAAAYGARFRRELDPLIVDLPITTPDASSPTGWLAVWNGALNQSAATLFGTTRDARALPTRRQHVIGALAALALLAWLALWVLIGFGVAVFP
jgi:hypothetical protein